MFGGKQRSPEILYGDTWEWDGATWQQVAESGPEARGMAAMTFDSKNNRVLMHGGRSLDRKAFGGLWAWDGSEWT
ncbi:MAG: hypothetical protein KTR29_11570 [Rhodothermaceae bacterium]|nr:hypothetical protein [Rhodothermaceae bacterium]